ncbi:MAG: hypothetical protein AAF696_31990, partial [Bacteroidota bacterium]
AEYYYQKDYLKEYQKGRNTKDVGFQILKEKGEAARSNLLEMLLAEENSRLLIKSSWFKANLEKELSGVVFSGERSYVSNIKMEQREKVTDFFLSRLNLGKAIKNTCKNFSGSNIVSLFLPRLLITLFLTWLSYTKLLKPNVSWEPLYVGTIFAIFFVLTISYLYREVKKLAPNLSFRKLLGRAFIMLLYSFLLSAALGAFFITFFLDSASKEEISKIQFYTLGGHDYAIVLWPTATVFVLFFSLFVNFLFKGQKFSGF